MSMTRKEAITCLQEKYDFCKSFYDLAAHPEEDYPEMKKYLQALQIALSALRGPTREQVEKLKTSVLDVNIDDPECEYGHCVACGAYVIAEDNFCSACGAPMTDKAVDMVMERLEALYEET